MAILGPDGNTFALNDAASQLLGPDATSAANSLYADPNANPTQVRSAVNDLFGAASTAAQDTAQATAQGITGEGDQQEANAYLTASGIADSNARLERVSGGIQQAQEDRTIYKTLSGQNADIASAGFNGDSLSALYLHADSAQQGNLAKSLLGTQTEITAGGFEEQSAAGQAEAAAASAAAGAASTLAGQASATGAMLQANALNNAFSLLGTGADGTTTTTNAGTTGGTSLDNYYGSPSLVGRHGVGVDASGYVLSGGAPQAASPFTGGAANPWAGINTTSGASSGGGGGGFKVVGTQSNGGLGPVDKAGGTLNLASDPNFGVD